MLCVCINNGSTDGAGHADGTRVGDVQQARRWVCVRCVRCRVCVCVLRVYGAGHACVCVTGLRCQVYGAGHADRFVPRPDR